MTERVIRSVESFIPNNIPARSEWTMWKVVESDSVVQDGFRLHRVETKQDWQQLLSARIAVERAFGVVDEFRVETIIEDVKSKVKEGQGEWFLFQHGGEVVGEIGYVPFKYQGQRVARLQDVDILPSFQGNGFGNRLLESLEIYLKSRQYDAMCLMAVARDWPKDWYLRYGFQKVGDTTK